MNIYLTIILTFMIGEYLLRLVVEKLNIKAASPDLPEEFKGYYDADRYKKAQHYLVENTNFILLKSAFFAIATILFILTGGFNYLDRFSRSFGLSQIPTGLVFAGTILVFYELLTVPFAAYRTFVIEEKYGFNKTTIRTFVSDIVKTMVLSALIGGAVFSSVVWLFETAVREAWVYCWASVTLFELFLTFIAPVIILPLFNKFIPLEEGDLKRAIEDYVDKEDFKIRAIFKLDASLRTLKSNAFFTGFGKYRRIALFDTLIQRHTVDELVSILAHEVGHYKRRHVIKHFALSAITKGVMFFILSLFIKNESLFYAFRMDETSIYAGIVFFGFLYAPISLIFGVLANLLSRRYEYEADLFVAKTYKGREAFITALKKLTVDNLSNLAPHPLKVFLDYSHPTVLERIKTFRSHIVY